ncbi:ferritin-like fold-containing protein [Agromyces sp. MMS24-K17]|uniref:ferritin-like fold-containing protein n=1 Tax=Agromyces sp. MMS24-K17 TaxID=3372850 RepID=UPI003755309A
MWSRRRVAHPEPALRPVVAPTGLTKVEFTALTPEPLAFLGQAAALQLEFFEGLALAVMRAPDLAAKEGVSAAAGIALRAHHALIAELRREGVEPVSMMAPFSAGLDRFRAAIAGDDWYELLLAIHLSSGLLDDFSIRLAGGLPADLRTRVRAILGEAALGPRLEAQLLPAIAEIPGLGDRLALWGRRVVGDTLLVARSALRAAERPSHLQDEVEPVFTELIGDHTRRMDALGLTA